MTPRVWFAFIALCVIWGTPYFFIKHALYELSPVWVAWGRLVCASLLLVPIALWRGQLQGMVKRWRVIVVFALVELAGPFYLIALGERWVSSSLAGILLAGVPLFVVIVSPLMGVHERIGRRRGVGLSVGLLGVVALLGLDTIQDSHGWLGAGAILLAAVGYAIGPLIVQKHLAGVDSLGIVAASVVAGAALLTVPAIFHRTVGIPVWRVNWLRGDSRNDVHGVGSSFICLRHRPCGRCTSSGCHLCEPGGRAAARRVPARRTFRRRPCSGARIDFARLVARYRRIEIQPLVLQPIRSLKRNARGRTVVARRLSLP
ncbi:MAG: DMT family transporter [Gammaproteobacteria bacterium]